VKKVTQTDGFSLVEVIVALALLGGVLISLSGLFVIGTQQVDGGRDHSMALAVARDILEETNGWGYRWLYDGFGVTATQNLALIDTRSPGYAAQWQSILDEQLRDAHAEIELRSITDGGGAPPAFEHATAIRIQVTVFWSQGPRTRSLSLTAVRM